MCFASLKTKILSASLVLYAIANLGCSNQWREANFDIDEQEIEELLTSIETSGDSGDASSEFFSIMAQENKVVFYADSRPEFGGIKSIFSIVDYSFLGPTFENLYVDDFVRGAVVFVAAEGPTGLQCALMIDMEANDQWPATDIKFFNCTSASFENGEFLAELSGSDGDIVLRSFDVYDGFFKSVIQMKLSIFDIDGYEVENGKFSTLVGFGL